MKGSSHASEVPERVPAARGGAGLFRPVGDEDGVGSRDHRTCLYNWVRQDRIDRGEIPGMTTAESRELRKARRRIRELEAEVEILRRANSMLDPETRRPKGCTR